MPQTIIKELTQERVNTMECVGVQRYWKAWLPRFPIVERFAVSEARAIASVWWHEGMISIEEAMRMIEGRQVWQPI